MLSKRVILLAFLVLFCAPALRAENSSAASDTQVYVVDMQRVIDDSIIGKAAKSNMDQEFKKGELKLKELKDEYEHLKDDSDKQASLLSAQALQDKHDALEKKGKELERAVQDKKDELARKNNGEIEKIVKQIDKVVNEMATKNKYKFIIEKDSRLVLYVDDKYDLTPKVIEELNQRKINLDE